MQNLFNLIASYFDNDWHTIASDLDAFFGLIGLAMTAYIAWSLRKIKNNYIFRVRAPEFLRVLKKQASTLIDYGNDFENNKTDIGVELTRVDVKLGALESRVSGNTKKTVKQLRRNIKVYKETPGEEKFYAVYEEIQRVVEEIKELQEKLNLE